MQTLEEGELQRAAQRANQNQACVASLPASTMNLFQGPRAGGGGVDTGGRGAHGSMNKGGYRSDVLVNLGRSNLRPISDGSP